jgi:hypothetical protein
LAESFAKADASPVDAEAGWREMFDRHGVATRNAEVDAAAKALGKNMTETEFARFAALKAEADRDVDEDPGLVIGGHN